MSLIMNISGKLFCSFQGVKLSHVKQSEVVVLESKESALVAVL